LGNTSFGAVESSGQYFLDLLKGGKFRRADNICVEMTRNL